MVYSAPDFREPRPAGAWGPYPRPVPAALSPAQADLLELIGKVSGELGKADREAGRADRGLAEAIREGRERVRRGRGATLEELVAGVVAIPEGGASGP